MTELLLLTGDLPFKIVTPSNTFSFPTPARRDLFLESWRHANHNSGIPMPVEGPDYKLEGPA